MDKATRHSRYRGSAETISGAASRGLAICIVLIVAFGGMAVLPKPLHVIRSLVHIAGAALLTWAAVGLSNAVAPSMPGSSTTELTSSAVGAIVLAWITVPAIGCLWIRRGVPPARHQVDRPQ